MWTGSTLGGESLKLAGAGRACTAASLPCCCPCSNGLGEGGTWRRAGKGPHIPPASGNSWLQSSRPCGTDWRGVQLRPTGCYTVQGNKCSPKEVPGGNFVCLCLPSGGNFGASVSPGTAQALDWATCSLVAILLPKASLDVAVVSWWA